MITNISKSFNKDRKRTEKVLTLAIKIVPPAIKQNAVINSVGGRPGKIEVGGDR
jgi:hypothetical protein